MATLDENLAVVDDAPLEGLADAVRRTRREALELLAVKNDADADHGFAVLREREARARFERAVWKMVGGA